MSKILLIDDDAAFGATVAVGLSELGHQVFVIGTAIDAAVVAQIHRPDAVVVDLDPAPEDRVGVCRWLKRHPQTASIPLIIVDGRGAPDEQVAVISAELEQL